MAGGDGYSPRIVHFFNIPMICSDDPIIAILFKNRQKTTEILINGLTCNHSCLEISPMSHKIWICKIHYYERIHTILCLLHNNIRHLICTHRRGFCKVTDLWRFYEHPILTLVWLMFLRIEKERHMCKFISLGDT